MLMELGGNEFRASITVGVEEASQPDLDALVETQSGRLARSLTDFEIVRRSTTVPRHRREELSDAIGSAVESFSVG